MSAAAVAAPIGAVHIVASLVGATADDAVVTVVVGVGVGVWCVVVVLVVVVFSSSESGSGVLSGFMGLTASSAMDEISLSTVIVGVLWPILGAIVAVTGRAVRVAHAPETMRKIVTRNPLYRRQHRSTTVAQTNARLSGMQRVWARGGHRTGLAQNGWLAVAEAAGCLQQVPACSIGPCSRSRIGCCANVRIYGSNQHCIALNCTW